MLDREKLRAQMEALENGGRPVIKSAMWKPENGEQYIRLLPDSNGNPFGVYHFHFGLKSSPSGIICPKRQFNNDCPICEFASQAWRAGDPASQELAKRLFAKVRYFTKIVVRDKDGNNLTEPKIWGFGKTAYKSLLTVSLDPDYGDVTDVNSGRDFKLVYTKSDKKGVLPTTQLTVRPKETPLAATPGEVADLLENIPEFDSLDLFNVLSSSQLKDMLTESFDVAEPEPWQDDSVESRADAVIAEVTNR